MGRKKKDRQTDTTQLADDTALHPTIEQPALADNAVTVRNKCGYLCPHCIAGAHGYSVERGDQGVTQIDRKEGIQ